MELKKITEANSRSNRVKQNIIYSFVFKAADTLVYLLLVPITLGFLNPYEYGIWLTLSSILAWIDNFDIGLGNGLRNKLAEAIANNDLIKARKYVSTAFFMLIGIMIILSIVGYTCIHFVDWTKLLNLTEEVDNLEQILQVSFFFFSLNFVLKFVGNVFQALQLPVAMYIINFAGHLISLVTIYILTITSIGSLYLTAIVYSIAPPLAYACAYPIAFKKLFKYLDPSIAFFDINCIRELFNLSFMFFLLQLAGLILLSSTNLIISNLFGPAQVTPFNIAQRYFGIVLMLSNIVLAPIWSATTDAYTKGEIEWIKSSNRWLNFFLLIIALILICMVSLSSFIYHFWIGDDVAIPFEISLFSAFYYFIMVWSLSYSYLLNGMGKLKLQTFVTITAACCFCPTCWYLGHIYSMMGVLIGMCILNLPGAIINTIQFHMVTGKINKLNTSITK